MTPELLFDGGLCNTERMDRADLNFVYRGLEHLARRAPAGPWMAWRNALSECDLLVTAPGQSDAVMFVGGGDYPEGDLLAAAQFIVVARQQVPALVASWREQQGVIARAVAELRKRGHGACLVCGAYMNSHGEGCPWPEMEAMASAGHAEREG